MPELSLDDGHLKMIQDILARHVPDRDVWAFGSRVGGRARRTSDLDLVIRGDRVPLETMAGLRLELEESSLPFRVDIVEWAALKPSFRELIREGHVAVQKAEKP